MRISSKQGATMTPKCANLIRDMYKLVKEGFMIDEAKQYLELEGWRCDKGYPPQKETGIKHHSASEWFKPEDRQNHKH